MNEHKQRSEFLNSNSVHLLGIGKISAFKSIKMLFAVSTVRSFFIGLFFGFCCLFSLKYWLGENVLDNSVPCDNEASSSNNSLTEDHEADVWVGAFLLWLSLGLISFTVYAYLSAINTKALVW